MKVRTGLVSILPDLRFCFTLDDLAALLGVDRAIVRAFAFQRAASSNYKYRTIPKRDGGFRVLAIPHSTLKMIQRRLVPHLASMYRPSSRAFAYINGRDIRGNAATHLGHRLVFTIDLVNFFGEINFGRVRGRLMAPPYSLSDAVATTIARLAIHGNALPFGAPTSPILSNMICSGLDAELATLGRETGSFYTRFADDIVFSTQKGRFAHQIVKLIESEGARQALPGTELDAIITRHGFQINASKTRLKTRHDSQIICGVVVNEKLNVRRRLQREIRGHLHAWQAHGTAKVQEYWVDKYKNPADKDFEPSLRGKIEFLCYIRGDNDDVVFDLVERFNSLTSLAPIKYEKPLEWRAALASSICIIQAESADLSKPGAKNSQGTGFVIDEGCILTNAHVACDAAGAALDKISVQFDDIKVGALEAELVGSSLALDLAILRLKDPIFAGVLKGRSMTLRMSAYPETGETMTLAGYPNHQDGDTVHVADGHVTGRSTIHGLGVFRISPNVIYGNSGGPVMNARGEVIGVAVCGSGISDAPYNIHNGAIPMRGAYPFIAKTLAAGKAGS